MKIFDWMAFCVFALAAAAPAAATEPAAALPGDSLYQLDLPLTDQTGRTFALRELRGRPQLVALFYTSCGYVCPLIIDTAKATERALPAASLYRLDVLLVSIDPARDDVAALAAVAKRRGLDAARWRLVRTDAEHVRELAAALGVQYRQLSDGEFNHASVLTALDAEGRIVKQSRRLGEADPDLAAALSGLVKSAPSP
ncbi:MAG TPA: SCO family protein [Tahibacter sp.]|uniref:SCO family protein n=1 Tax=Tahibacter sp. TaxID=2056211 RepID=UPI002CB7C03D|nr:SCO family protein [Tahibacter sp.]HSX59151.1 SCO family protein [Tahibacter sp.]